MFEEVIDFIRSKYPKKSSIALHEPTFSGNEKAYLNECIDSGFVSSVGRFVNQFEEEIAKYVGVKYGVAAVNGTSALHLALRACGVSAEEEVLTQSFTFVGTVAPIVYLNAHPVFMDISTNTLGMCPEKLNIWLEENAEIKEDGNAYNRQSGRRLAACVPMHTFGHPCEIDKIIEICKLYSIQVIEDAAESMGSKYFERHTGSFAKCGVLSFNGNKTITSGGGGMILTNDEDLAKKAKHLSTTAKLPHSWEFIHDEVGFNYRLTNLSAALGLAQLEKIDDIISNKRQLSADYQHFFSRLGFNFFSEPENSRSNYWLNSIIMNDRKERDSFLKETNDAGIMTRPAWKLIHTLGPYKSYQAGDLTNSEYFAERIVNIPSSVT